MSKYKFTIKWIERHYPDKIIDVIDKGNHVLVVLDNMTVRFEKRGK